MLKRNTACLLAFTLFCFSTPAFGLSIAMVLWRGETAAETGFIAELESLGYSPEITRFNADQSRDQLSTIIRQQLAPALDQYDYVYSFGTTVTKALATHLKGRVPHVFNIVSYPAKAGILPSEQGGRPNTAGVSSRIAVENQIKGALQHFEVQRLAVLFNPREANATQQLQELVGLGKKYAFDVIPVRIRPDHKYFNSDLQRLNQLENLSAVYLPSDSFLISNAPAVLTFINSLDLRSVCAVSAYMKHGCLLGTVADYARLGALAASQIDRHVKGAELADLPVEFDLNPTPVLNHATQVMLSQQ